MTRGLSKRSVCLQYGFNLRALETLIDEGVLAILPGCTPLRPLIDPIGLNRLQEGLHFVRCLECGAAQAIIHSKHLRACSGMTSAEYIGRYPHAPMMSESCRGHKAKTQEQRQVQSRKLKTRFQTPDGEITRHQISEASIRMQSGPIGIRAAEHLRWMAQSPDGRERSRIQSRAMYAAGKNPSRDWHWAHRAESLDRAAHARRHILRKRTKPHLGFKAALEASGVPGFITEFEVGYHAIDEARPDLRLAVEVDGCYWHGCPDCGFPGVSGTQAHDRSKETFLRNRGWDVIHVRECEIKLDIQSCISRVKMAVAGKLSLEYVV